VLFEEHIRSDESLFPDVAREREEPLDLAPFAARSVCVALERGTVGRAGSPGRYRHEGDG
jgi:hypothetical protein